MRALYAGAAIVAIAILAAVIYYERPGSETGRPVVTAPAPAGPPPAGATVPGPAAEEALGAADARAGFDVVRVALDGQAVIAGRALPGAEVTVRAGEEVVGKVIADPRGEWVLVPERPLPPGPSELRLEMTRPDGSRATGGQVAVVVVPERKAPEAGRGREAIVALSPTEGGSTEVLQGVAKSQSGSLSVATADVDEGGQAVITGQAPAGATVRAYIDDQPAGTARADDTGTWRLRPASPLAPGTHRLRIDQLGPEGQVDVRVEVPLTRDEAIRLALLEGRIIVQSGDNLWRIARVAYGAGLRYTTIYEANRDQIRDPDLIYPGQVFELPVSP